MAVAAPAHRPPTTIVSYRGSMGRSLGTAGQPVTTSSVTGTPAVTLSSTTERSVPRCTTARSYHHFGDKEGLLAAVVDFGWAAFLETKRTAAAVVHEHVADDVRAGWDNHLEFARENPNFYKLMWPRAAPSSSPSWSIWYARRTRCSTNGWSLVPPAASCACLRRRRRARS